MISFGTQSIGTQLTLTTNAQGSITDARLAQRPFIATENGQVLNSAVGVTINKATGTINTGRAGTRSITVYLLAQ